MLYAFVLLDKPGAADLRHRVRPEHTRAGLYASSAIHAFANLWPQKAGFPPAPA